MSIFTKAALDADLRVADGADNPVEALRKLAWRYGVTLLDALEANKHLDERLDAEMTKAANPPGDDQLLLRLIDGLYERGVAWNAVRAGAAGVEILGGYVVPAKTQATNNNEEPKP